MTKERPILFSGSMVRAILAGQKTVTRRVVKLPRWGIASTEDVDAGAMEVCTRNGCTAEVLCPYGVAGDTLWVRETWRADDFDPADTIYRADIPADVLATAGDLVTWRPSIFLPRARSRLTLRVASVRVERLSAITTDDIAAEGVRYPVDREGHVLLEITGKAPVVHYLPRPRGPYTEAELMRAHFASIWDTINGPGAWDSNPWVWRVEFERMGSGRG